MKPMMIPANPAGARPSTAAPNTVNTRMAVPMTSAAKPIPIPALALTSTAPSPRATGSLPVRMMSVSPAPMSAPASCAAMYPIAVVESIFRVASNAIVTAGLMWQPLMWPTEYTAAKIAKANANEIVDSSALPNGLSPVSNTVSGTDPAPMNTRMAVPIASAVSFCERVGDDIWGFLLRLRVEQPGGLGGAGEGGGGAGG